MSAVDRDFWARRRVLVTGHTGFKGSWLCLWLQRLGAEVAGLSNDVPTRPALFEAARVADGMVDLRGDVRDLGRVEAAVAETAPEVVLHLAAQPIVLAAFADPVATYATNVMGTVHVLEAVRRVGGVRVVVNVTTDKVYENREWEWGYREVEALGGRDPYATSKAASEHVSAAYRASYFTGGRGPAHATARAGNVIGGGDWAPDRLVPDLVRGAVRGEPVPIRHPGAVRPWQHVLAPLHGYLLLAQALWDDDEIPGAWNFGPDPADALPVGTVADRFAELWGPGASWERDGARRAHEAHFLHLDSARARTRLGWAPRWGIDEALEAVVAFARAEQGGADVREVLLGQIAQYEAGRAPAPVPAR
jgi:CDP-glucose 4,6-dehydratase